MNPFFFGVHNFFFFIMALGRRLQQHIQAKDNSCMITETNVQTQSQRATQRCESY